MAKNNTPLFSKIILIDSYMTQLTINSILHDVIYFILIDHVQFTVRTDKTSEYYVMIHLT